jgi:hypothetical protein
MKYTTLSSFQKNMGQKPLPHPKTQIKFVFMLIPLSTTTQKFVFKDLKNNRSYLFNLKL